jgi:preprotein translocase subunit SecG
MRLSLSKNLDFALPPLEKQRMGFRPPSVFAIGALLLSTLVARRSDAGDFDPGEDRVVRVTYESVAGLGGLAVGLLAAVGVGVAAKESGPDPVGAGAVLAVVTGVAAVVFLQPAGVYLAGHLSGANGNYGPALLGDVIGLGAAVGVGCATLASSSSSQEKMLPVVLISALVLPLTGAVMGYELSTHRTSDAQSNLAQQNKLSQPRPILGWSVTF